MRHLIGCSALSCAVSLLGSAGSVRAASRDATAAEAPAPWRLHEVLGVPWLRFGLEHRVRAEHLRHDFRSANAGDATALSFRTLLSAELRFLPFVVGAEAQDSRVSASRTTPLNTTLADPLDVLQAWAGLRGSGWLWAGDSLAVTAGRMTLDLGSRRLVARNEFRNTISSFTGLDLQWTSSAGDTARAFAVTPVLRLPSEPDALRRGALERDRENLDALLWAAWVQPRPLPAGVVVEAYVVGLHERDSGRAPSTDRRLLTPGARVLRAPATGELDLQVEAMAQLGRSRATSSATDTTDLEHSAYALDAALGWRFDTIWVPRLALQYDYASGDRSPSDRTNGRFDPLYGARRFELGPTGLYGAVGRSNLSSPGARLEVQPHRTLDAFAAYRLVWLAAKRDAWTTAGVRDPSGGSGAYVGQQLELRVRWHVAPKNLALEVGGAHLVRGEFATDAPGGRTPNATLGYAQVTGSL
ncbi:MAG: alginate export family protein [Polyangiaceae bacterium]|nr:alginate export family protein [Polyangiaceae bacterium]